MTGVAWIFMSVAFVVILGTAGLAWKKLSEINSSQLKNNFI